MRIKVEKSSKRIWKENGFFKDQGNDLTIGKPNFQENALVYINNGSITSVKDGYATYLEFVIIEQILPYGKSTAKHGFRQV